MKCTACGSEEQRVLSTRASETRVVRLRCCAACGHRWNTVELDAQNLSKMDAAVQVLRSFNSLSKELNDAAPAHG